jgi:hypothetical protein
MHLVVDLLSSLYSTPVCRFRLMSCGKFILFFLTFLSSCILCYLSFLLLLNIILLSITNMTGITYILPQLDLALLAHMMFSFIHILYCHNLISHCWCSFLYIFYSVTTWSRTAVTYYDVLFVYIFYTVTALVYIYCMILLYSDLSPTILTEVAQQGNIVAPWGWHCFAETCRSHCISK